MVPLTGIPIHKMASVIFLLLSIIHTIVYRKKLGAKKYLLLFLTVLSFVTGLFGMILEQIPLIMILHRCISILVVFFMAKKPLFICKFLLGDRLRNQKIHLAPLLGV